MPRGADGALMDLGAVSVDLDSSGNGTAQIVFGETFNTAPSVWLRSRLSDAGTWAVSSISVTGATLTVTSSDTRSARARIGWVAMEPMA